MLLLEKKFFNFSITATFFTSMSIDLHPTTPRERFHESQHYQKDKLFNEAVTI